MALTRDFQEAVKNGDIRLVRIMIKDSMIVDPTFIELNQMLSLAEASVADLYDKHNGEKLNYESSCWTKDYMDEQMVQVVYNFSEERLSLLKSICKYLYKDKAVKIEQVRAYKSTRNNLSKKQVGTGALIGGVAVAVVGIAVSKPIIIGAGAVAAIVGGILIATGE